MTESSSAREQRDELAERLNDELRRIAQRELRRLRPGQTLDTTSLVNECYLKMSRGDPAFQDRSHFLAASAQAMRHILLNAARRRMAHKRGSGAHDTTLDEEIPLADQHAEDILLVHDAINRLAEIDRRLSTVVVCRFFAGLSEHDTAQAIGVSERTVRRDWQRARAWLKIELGRDSPPTLVTRV